MKKRIMLVSDVHYCHVPWYGISSEERMERLITHLNDEYRKDPYEIILFLGDYSLDFWEWEIKGCYINEKRSYTRAFVEEYCPRLPAPFKMIAGNHEQYGGKKWHEITGCWRQDEWSCEGWLFLLLDSFAADLDPQQHSDGTFTPIDVAYVRRKMAEYPNQRVILCSHHFDFDRETDEARSLMADQRIVCLVSGHVHRSDIVTIPENAGFKKIFHTGHYSYAAEADPRKCMFGFRDMILTDNALVSRYITPANRVFIDGKTIDHPYGMQDEIKIGL